MMKKSMFAMLIACMFQVMSFKEGFAAYLFDTGTPDTSFSLRSYDIKAERPLIAVQFTNTKEWHISSIEGYFMTYPSPSNLQVKIWQENNTDIPGDEYLVSAITTLKGNGMPLWQGVDNLDWTLPAGTWWVGFTYDSGWSAEIIAGSRGVPDNSSWEVQYGFRNSKWKWNNSSDYNFSLRIKEKSVVSFSTGVWLLSAGLLGLAGLNRFRKSPICTIPDRIKKLYQQ